MYMYIEIWISFAKGKIKARGYLTGAVKRALGCAAGPPGCPIFQGWCFQVVMASSGSVNFSRPSHQTSPSAVSATFVKIEFFVSVRIAFGFDFIFVPGATPTHKPNTTQE